MRHLGHIPLKPQKSKTLHLVEHELDTWVTIPIETAKVQDNSSGLGLADYETLYCSIV